MVTEIKWHYAVASDILFFTNIFEEFEQIINASFYKLAITVTKMHWFLIEKRIFKNSLIIC